VQGAQGTIRDPVERFLEGEPAPNVWVSELSFNAIGAILSFPTGSPQ
jgi:hypothetical protein